MPDFSAPGIERSRNFESTELQMERERPTHVKVKEQGWRIKTASDALRHVSAVDVDNDDDESKRGCDSRSMNLEGVNDENGNRFGRHRRQSTDTVADDVDRISDCVHDAETLETTRSRKSRFSREEVEYWSDQHLQHQMSGALAPSSSSSISRDSKRTASRHCLPSSAAGYIRLIDGEVGPNDYDQRPIFLPKRCSMNISHGDASKKRGIKSNFKHLIDEEGQTWKYVGMRKGQNGNMRRQYAMQSTHVFNKDWQEDREAEV